MTSENSVPIPNSGNHGQGATGVAGHLRPLTDKQEEYMRHYFVCDGSATCIAKAMDWNTPDGQPDRQSAQRMGKQKRIQIEIARRVQQQGAQLFMNKQFNVAKEDRLELLWMIAQGGAERITDKEGNMVFMNPAVSVSAIRTINEMLPGSLAPKEVEITHKQDTRSEQEIRENIARLNEEYQSLIAIDGNTITLKESDIKKSESLPLVTPDGKVHNKGRGKKVHVP